MSIEFDGCKFGPDPERGAHLQYHTDALTRIAALEAELAEAREVMRYEHARWNPGCCCRICAYLAKHGGGGDAT